MTTHNTHHDAPALSAVCLAHTMLDTGWTLAAASVRVVHTASLADGSGLTVAISAEAGRVRLGFTSEYRESEGLRRLSWIAESDRELPGEVLAAVASANNISFDDGDDGPTVEDLLNSAGWHRHHPDEDAWLSPDGTREVVLLDEDLEYTDLPWEIRRRAGTPVTIRTCTSTPALVIAAFALTDLPEPRRADRHASGADTSMTAP